MSSTKRCRHCNVVKNADEFTKDKSARDGLKTWCKPCVASYEKARMEPFRTPPERMTADERKVASSRWKKAYRDKHKSELYAKRKIRREADRETTRAETRRYYWRHREKQLARVAAYFKAHPEVKRQSQAKRKALKFGNAIDSVDYKAIEARDRMVCHLCGEKVKRSERRRQSHDDANTGSPAQPGDSHASGTALVG